MKVVCDTSALIKLQKGEAIDCLGQLFDQVLVPPAVAQECQDLNTKAALQKPFFKTHGVSQLLPLSGIGRGEREAISLAVEHSIQVLIVDDEKAFRRATEHGLLPIRSFRVLLLAKRKDLIPSVQRILDRMISRGEGIQDELYHDILIAAGEMTEL